MKEIFNALIGTSIFIVVYIVIISIVTIVSLYKIFDKENIKPIFSIIPFVNIYYYLKICGLPFWTIFIPFLNIIVLICAPYVITKKYRCPKWQSTLAIFFPFIFLPYIAFSNKRNINFKPDSTYIRNTKELDNLESKLKQINNSDNAYLNEKIVENNNVANNDSLNEINKIDNDPFQDEYVYDEYQEIENENAPVDTEVNEFTYLDDEISIDDLTNADIDILEEELKVETSVEKNIVTDIKDYKAEDVSNEAIAFGGEQKIENSVNVQAKTEDLKCPRCGSSLVGANGTCPGCGANLEEIKKQA